MRQLQKFLSFGLVALGLLLTSGCTTTSMLLGAAGVATDTSLPWAIVKHLHDKFTEGDPLPCGALNSVERALSPRCGEFVRGSLQTKDIAAAGGLQECPLILAAQDSRLWPVLPELLNKGAQVESCWQSPLVTLADATPCPAFEKASPEVLKAFTWMAEADSRAIRHDVVRMLSCPHARVAGLHHVLETWEAAGALSPGNVGFGPLGALSPDYLDSPFARQLETDGHTAQASLGSYQGKLSPGFEEALRQGDRTALDWWLKRLPRLANRVTATQGGQLDWVPLARVLVPTFLNQPERQAEMINYLLAHGADPWQRLPSNTNQTVAAYAHWMHSPNAALLDPPIAGTVLARTASSRDGGLRGGENVGK